VLQNESDREFLYFALVGLRDTINQYGAAGATMVNLSKGKLLNLEVVYPDPTTLVSFHEAASPLFEQIRVVQLKNETLRCTRDILLPRLISGEVDVSDMAIDTGGVER